MALTGIGFFACLGYFEYLARTGPTRPDTATGLVVRMNDHGYYFYVHPWQGWLLNAGPFACVGAFFLVAAVTQRTSWRPTKADFPRWLKWLYLAALLASIAYVFWRFP
ncbi:MAG: hypothetical protein KGJ66_07585 [Alphaproteobacteria bacterium]|nr:hypothetical protein [Alphaproteobacteria bacterium]